MQSPASSVVFEFGGYSLHYYGVIMFCAIITAVFVIHFVAKKYYKDVDTELVLDILPGIILFSLLGARTYYVLMDFSYYANHPAEIFAVWNGGMSIHGGIIGGVLSGLAYAKIKNFSFLKYADVFAYGLVLGQAIGRFGNYFNCEAFGKPCSIPYIKLFIPLQYRPFGFEEYSYFHPAFLYESLWDVFVFLMLFFVVRKFAALKKLSDGTVFFSYLLLYSIGRFFIEWCRLDSVRDFFGLPVAQIVSIAVIVLSSAVLLVLNGKKR